MTDTGSKIGNPSGATVRVGNKKLGFWEQFNLIAGSGTSGFTADAMFGGVPEHQAKVIEETTGMNPRVSDIVKKTEVWRNTPLTEGTTVDAEGEVLRYPASPAIRSDSDYVLCTFFKYLPPAKQGVATGDIYQIDYKDLGENKLKVPQKEKTTYKNTYLNVYNNTSVGRLHQGTHKLEGAANYERTNEKQIMLYMPEDISSGFQADWNGKAISTAGKDMMSAAASSGFGNKIDRFGSTLSGMMQRVGATWSADTIRGAVSSITGDTLTNDEIFGAIGGIITNPNTELLFNALRLRNFQLKWKLVPRNATEAREIKGIVTAFKRAMLPGTSVDEVFKISAGEGVTAGFISVPDLVRVSFMNGSSPADYLPQYKMCAITQVDVNYTPDGSYAKIVDVEGNVGGVVAMELTVGFQETKLVYREEVQYY